MQATATATTHTFPWVKWMAEINENTKVVIKAGSIFGAILLLLFAGKYWGSWESDATNIAKAVDAHEVRLSGLETRMAGVDQKLALILQSQDSAKDQSGATFRNTQYGIELLRDIETALAKGGITTEKHGP